MDILGKKCMYIKNVGISRYYLYYLVPSGTIQCYLVSPPYLLDDPLPKELSDLSSHTGHR